jgi:uncharacterized alkaline shock family protein YloU
MTEPTPGIPAQTSADAAPDAGATNNAYTPGSVPTFGAAQATASTEFPAQTEAASGHAAEPATAQPDHGPNATADSTSDQQAGLVVAGPVPTAADRATQLVDRAGDAINDAAEKAHDAIGEAAEKAGEAISAAADRAGDALSEAAHNAVTRLRNNATLPAARGRTTIANEVVEKIAGIAAREVPGVYDLGGDVARLFSSIKERLNLGEESKAQGVSVRLDGAAAEITVTIVVEFGFVVSSVTDKVREKVISSVEALLQLDVKAVDVVVDDIHVDEDGPIGNDKERAHGYNSATEAIVVGQ